MSSTITDEYAAGLVEARGRVREAPRGRGTYRLRVEVSLVTLDRPLVDAVHRHFGCGTVDSFRPRSNPQLELWAWTVRGRPAEDVLERLIPHMVGHMRETAEEFLDAQIT